MASPETPNAETFESEAPELLNAIARARKRVEGTAGLVDGTLDRFRERIDRLLRESEVDNWRQVRIFNRDVDALAADLGKAAKEKRLSPRLVAALDGSLRKARKRDFYGARKAWRRLDRIADMGAEVRRLQTEYREGYRAVEARIRQLRNQIERMSKIPKPPASPEDARTFNDRGVARHRHWGSRPASRVRSGAAPATPEQRESPRGGFPNPVLLRTP